MKLNKVSSLDLSRTEQIKNLVNICTDHDKTSVSFPFDEAELFLFVEDDHAVISAIAFVPVEKGLYECSAFTRPDFRSQGFFTDLLDAGIEALPEDSELLFYTDSKNKETAAVLDAIGAELDSEEHMMKLLPEDFFTAAGSPEQLGSPDPSFMSDKGIHVESLDIDGTPTLHFYSDHAVVNFSVFPSHYYLYGFEVQETLRGKGYGTKFLHAVLAHLFTGNNDVPSNLPYKKTDSASLPAVPAINKTSSPAVLLQVAGDNAPALALYKKTGFRITETLCCYLY